MRFSTTFLSVSGALMMASAGYAQEAGTIAPLPAPAQERITPQGNADEAILTTHKNINDAATVPPAAPLPWQNAVPAQAPSVQGAPAAAPFSTYQGKVPFGHAEPMAPIIPEGPHTTVSVPVVDVDAQEPAEAAPPTPVPAQADPAKEDPANPTELTSPIFGDSDTSTGPKKIVLRVLNKVTAQSQLLTFKPGENVKMGTLEITAITCQTSSPTSQTDYAGLLDIFERVPNTKNVKQLFRGWMYASSPSISALEHPVYDVTMVECQTPAPAKKEEKAEEKSVKKAKK